MGQDYKRRYNIEELKKLGPEVKKAMEVWGRNSEVKTGISSLYYKIQGRAGPYGSIEKKDLMMIFEQAKREKEPGVSIPIQSVNALKEILLKLPSGSPGKRHDPRAGFKNLPPPGSGFQAGTGGQRQQPPVLPGNLKRIK